MSSGDRTSREDSPRCIAGPVMENTKRRLGKKSQKLRHEERMARKRDDEEQAEEYRKAANALENALSAVEDYLGEDR